MQSNALQLNNSGQILLQKRNKMITLLSLMHTSHMGLKGGFSTTGCSISFCACPWKKYLGLTYTDRCTGKTFGKTRDITLLIMGHL